MSRKSVKKKSKFFKAQKLKSLVCERFDVETVQSEWASDRQKDWSWN